MLQHGAGNWQTGVCMQTAGEGTVQKHLLCWALCCCCVLGRSGEAWCTSSSLGCQALYSWNCSKLEQRIFTVESVSCYLCSRYILTCGGGWKGGIWQRLWIAQTLLQERGVKAGYKLLYLREEGEKGKKEEDRLEHIQAMNPSHLLSLPPSNIQPALLHRATDRIWMLVICITMANGKPEMQTSKKEGQVI